MTTEIKKYSLRELKQELEDLYPDDNPIYLTGNSNIKIVGEKPGEFQVVETNRDTGNQEIKFIAKSQQVAGYILPSEELPHPKQ